MLKNEHLRQVLDSVDVTYVARDNREALEQKIISHWSRTGGSGAASARGEQEGARPEGGEQGGSCDGIDVEEEDKSDTAASPSSVGVLVKASKQIPRRVGNEQLRLQMQKRGLQGLEALLEAEYFATDTLAMCCVQPSLPERP